MTLLTRIHEIFGPEIFKRPLFYSNAHSLRLELSESRPWLQQDGLKRAGSIEQFMTAMYKAEEVCAEVFSDHSEVVVCIKLYSSGSLFSVRDNIRTYRSMGLLQACHGLEYWREPSGYEDGDETYAYCFLMRLPVVLVRPVLWGAFAQDFHIEPNPRGVAYLFSLEKQVALCPYDDRGMDIVGPHRYLAHLYQEFNDYLLDYDREAMDASFARLTMQYH